MSGGIHDTTEIMRVEDVSVDFQSGKDTVHALKNVNFSLRANSFNIVYGPSGSGKSTLLNVIGGLQQPSRGRVVVQGRDLYGMQKAELANFRANRVGFIHQTNHWIKSLNVIDNLAMPLYAIGYSRQRVTAIVNESLARVDMKEYARKFPHVLSGGEQQRLALARALANEPIFIIADEPTGNLDSVNGDRIMRLLLNCQSEFRRTIVLVTHNMEYISFADHLLSIQDGVVTDIDKGELTVTTEKLLRQTKVRIKELAKVKANA